MYAHMDIWDPIRYVESYFRGRRVRSAINQQILLVCLYEEIRWAEIANFGGE